MSELDCMCPERASKVSAGAKSGPAAIYPPRQRVCGPYIIYVISEGPRNVTDRLETKLIYIS